MSNSTLYPTPTARLFLADRRPYGVTEQKKAEMDALTILVADAQQDVDQSQAIVDSLSDKLVNVQGLLAAAEDTRTNTSANKTLMDQLVQSATDLSRNSAIAKNEVEQANQSASTLAPEVKVLMDKVIYCAEIINKLSNIITRKKALNPLISDELISLIATAGKDANTAVALTLVALQSTFATQASTIESAAAIDLEYAQAGEFLNMLVKGSGGGWSLQFYMDNAYKKARSDYRQIEKALVMTTKQLNDAAANLNTATVKLKSLQSGLAAANAAAYAA